VGVFGLVPGGQHGAWCWSRLVPELELRGHEAIAIDLPIDDIDAGAAVYARVVAEALDGVTEPVVLVGHSLGGLTIPLVPALRPVRRLVFLCAAHPEPGRSYFGALAEESRDAVGPMTRSHLDGSAPALHRSTPQVAREIFYSDVDRDLQDWAIPQLRPQSGRPHREITPLEAWPDTPTTVIHAADDRAIPLPLAVRRTRRLFGVDPIVIPGGHSPFLSRPAELAELLAGLADD
jgi:pimeloyl-ACP methyl ester carboxylesterase